MVESLHMEIQQGKFPPPPGLIGSLARGFDSVATHIAVILPPLLLDLFLWIGPRLRLQQALQPYIDRFPALMPEMPQGFPDIAVIQQTWTEVLSGFNLFTALRTFPLGVSSLLSWRLTGDTPLGAPAWREASGALDILGWLTLLVLAGWVLGALYFHWVARAAFGGSTVGLGRSLSRALLLSVLWVGVLAVISAPAFVLLSVTALLSPFLAQLVFISLLVFGAWMLMPVFFSPHGIYTFDQDALRALLGSLRMVRFTLPNTGLFLLTFLLLNNGLNFLWTTPPQDSWWMLVGILGHAFVSTALLAASFVYYRDLNTWLKVVFELLQKQRTQPQST